jgi:hypothetical protein
MMGNDRRQSLIAQNLIGCLVVVLAARKQITTLKETEFCNLPFWGFRLTYSYLISEVVPSLTSTSLLFDPAHHGGYSHRRLQ